MVRSLSDRIYRYRITNLSHDGMWLNTPNPARAGEVVVVCFRPLRDWDYQPLHVFGQVVRVMSVRHQPGELAPDVGMGLELLDLTHDEQTRLALWLKARKQPLVRRRRPLPRRSPASGSEPTAQTQPQSSSPAQPMGLGVRVSPQSLRPARPVVWR